MTTRINAYQVAPQALEPMMALEAQIAASGLETSLI